MSRAEAAASLARWGGPFVFRAARGRLEIFDGRCGAPLVFLGGGASWKEAHDAATAMLAERQEDQDAK